MSIRLPRAPGSYQPTVLQTAFGAIERALSRTISKGQILDEIILKSPNGTAYGVTVDNAGNLVTTAK